MSKPTNGSSMGTYLYVMYLVKERQEKQKLAFKEVREAFGHLCGES